MLRTGPWNRLGLTVQWLAPKYKIDFPTLLQPPVHMPIQEGLVISKKVELSKITDKDGLLEYPDCHICKKPVSKNNELSCVDTSCSLKAHIMCLASHCLKSDLNFILPLDGSCPVCFRDFLWPDVIRKSKGCYQSQDLAFDSTTISDL